MTGNAAPAGPYGRVILHIAAVLELVLGEVLAAEIIDTVVGLRLAVIGVYLRRQGCRLAQMIVPHVLARRAWLEIYEVHALRAERDLRLRLFLLRRDDIRHNRFSSLFGMWDQVDTARLLRHPTFSFESDHL